jgi:hypothetical protein
VRLPSFITSPANYFETAWLSASDRMVATSAWVVGVAYSIERVDKGLASRSVAIQPGGSAPPLARSEQLIQTISERWLDYWLWCAAWGLVGGFLAWFLNGFAWRVLLRFSGVGGVSSDAARRAAIFCALFWSVPLVSLHLAVVPFYGSYSQAYESPLIDVLMVPFIVFGYWVAFAVARRHFKAPPLRSAFWFFLVPNFLFVVLPVLIGVVAGVAWALAQAVGGDGTSAP